MSLIIAPEKFEKMVTEKFIAVKNLAEYLGISQLDMSWYVRGGPEPPHSCKVLISQALGINLCEIWEFDSEDAVDKLLVRIEPPEPTHDPESFAAIYRVFHPNASAAQAYTAFLAVRDES